MFVLTSNWFRKWFSGKLGVWLLLQIRSNWKAFPVDRKLEPKQRKIIFVFIFTSTDFQPWKIEERERKSKKIADVGARRSHRSKTIALLRSFKPTLVEPSHRSSRLSHHFRTTHEERDRESREIVAPRTHSHQRTHSHRFILVLVWNFCNKICLWFWFFTFSLLSLILLLLWWRGWWCFGGFPVVWWWVLWGWWWKISFLECY